MTNKQEKLVKENIKQILKQRATIIAKFHSHQDWKYSCYEKLVLDCGVEMEVQPLAKNIKKGLPKSCYWNCQQLVFANPKLTYVEGYAITDGMPSAVNHAWLLTDDYKAIDPTWEDLGIAYMGVPFSTQWLKSFLQSRKKRENHLSIFESNYLEKYSFLRDGLPLDAKSSTRKHYAK